MNVGIDDAWKYELTLRINDLRRLGLDSMGEQPGNAPT